MAQWLIGCAFLKLNIDLLTHLTVSLVDIVGFINYRDGCYHISLLLPMALQNRSYAVIALSININRGYLENDFEDHVNLFYQ